MGVRYPSVFTTTILNANTGVNVETLMATTPFLVLPFDGAAVMIYWYLNHTIGATAASSQYNIRRGGAAGLMLNQPSNFTETAGNVTLRSGCYVDANPGAGTPQYSLTCRDVASTAGGLVTDVCIFAFAL